MDQYKENENNLENNPTNENDGREPVIPEPEFEEVKTQQAKESEPQTDLDGVTQAHDDDTTQFTVENTSESKNAKPAAPTHAPPTAGRSIRALPPMIIMRRTQAIQVRRLRKAESIPGRIPTLMQIIRAIRVMAALRHQAVRQSLKNKRKSSAVR